MKIEHKMYEIAENMILNISATIGSSGAYTLSNCTHVSVEYIQLAQHFYNQYEVLTFG